MNQDDIEPADTPPRVGVGGLLRVLTLLIGLALTVLLVKMAFNMGSINTTMERLEQQLGDVTRDLGNINSRMHLLAGSVVDNQARFGQEFYNIRMGMDRMSITLQSVNKDVDDLSTQLSNLNNKVASPPPAMPWQSTWPR